MTSSRDLSKALKFIDKTLTVAAATGTVNVDLSLYNRFDLTLSGNTTLTFSNAPALSSETFSVLGVVRNGTTPYTFTQPGNATVVGTAPVTPAATKQAIYIYDTKNGTAFDLYAGPAT